MTEEYEAHKKPEPGETSRPAREPEPEGNFPSFDAQYPEDPTSSEPVLPTAEDSAWNLEQDEVGPAGGESGRTRTGNLFGRVTDSLKRATGGLRRSPKGTGASSESDWMADMRQGEGIENVDPNSAQPGEQGEEKPKSVTGQLFKMITGRLSGGEETPGGQESGQTGRTGRLGRSRPKTDESYIAEIRQNLASSEVAQQEKRGSGGLFSRITSSLRRATGSLRGTNPLDKTPDAEGQPAAQIQPEIEDRFLADRLGGSSLENETVLELGSGEFNYAEVDDDLEDFVAYDEAVEADTRLSGDEPISLLDSGAIAALGKAEELENEPDWMAEIRQEAAEEETGLKSAPTKEGGKPEGTGETPKKKGVSGQLRSFISGILGAQEANRRRTTGEEEVPDEMVSNRLGLNAADEQTLEKEEPATENRLGAVPGLDEDLEIEDVVFDEDTSVKEEKIFTGDLMARFQQMSKAQLESEETAEARGQEDEDLYDLTPEDEALLWGTRPEKFPEEPPPITIDSVWEQQSGVGETLTEEPVDFDQPLPGEPFETQEIADEIPTNQQPTTFRPLSNDAYAASFLTGEEVEYVEEVPDTILRGVLEKSERDSERVSLEDMRAIALEGYRDVALPQAERRPEAQPTAQAETSFEDIEVPEFVEEEEEELPVVVDNSLKAQIARSTLLQKVIVAEAVLVVIALLVAVPFFVRVMMNGPVSRPVTAILAPRSLPADIPYPTGVTLPGGWYFKLDKSTFVDGKWKPAKPEWLEGTELRRVIALPWNAQTEAVVQTFQKGDKINLYLSNKDTIRYRVSSIERVMVGNVDILSDRKPSLAIVLYKEDSEERWVVICRP